MSAADIIPDMKLSDYLTAHAVTYSGFAAAIGVANAKVVERYAKQQRIPRPEIMRKIVGATGGAVRADDFYPWPASRGDCPPRDGNPA